MLPKLTEIAAHGLIEVQDTTVINPATDKKRPQPDRAGRASCNRRPRSCASSSASRTAGRTSRCIWRWSQALRANDIAGVTVYRGILGYGANRRMHKDSALNLSHDAPMLLTVVDTEEKLRAFFPVLDQMVKQGLVVMSDAEVIKYSHAAPLPTKEEKQK